jgi:hypothetical protein
VNEAALHARLVNAEGELLAEGSCWLDEPHAQATLEPERPASAIRKERGDALTLELESGRTLKVSDRLMVVRIASPGNSNGNARRSLYRLRLLSTSSTGLTTSAQDVLPGRTAGAEMNDAQDANAAGAMGEGAPALRFGEETPAAR